MSKIGTAEQDRQPGGIFPGSGQGLQPNPKPIPDLKKSSKMDNCNPQNEKARG